LTETRHHHRLPEKPSQSNCVAHSEEEASRDEGGDELGLDPNHFAEVARYVPAPARAARQIVTEMPAPVLDKELDTVTDELLITEEPGTVTVDAPIPSSSNVNTETNTSRPQRIRNPPVMLSYYSLGTPADVRTVFPQFVSMPVMSNPQANIFTLNAYTPHPAGPTTYSQPLFVPEVRTILAVHTQPY